MDLCELEQKITAAVTETIENMAFMEVVPGALPSGRSVAPAPSPASATLPPSGRSDTVMGMGILVLDPVQGEMRMLTTAALSGKIAANILGPGEEDISEQQQNDIAAELVNIIAGRFLAEILATKDTFRLGLPLPCDTELPEADEQQLSWKFTIEGQPLTIIIRGESFIALCLRKL